MMSHVAVEVKSLEVEAGRLKYLQFFDTPLGKQHSIYISIAVFSLTIALAIYLCLTTYILIHSFQYIYIYTYIGDFKLVLQNAIPGEVGEDFRSWQKILLTEKRARLRSPAANREIARSVVMVVVVGLFLFFLSLLVSATLGAFDVECSPNDNRCKYSRVIATTLLMDID